MSRASPTIHAAACSVWDAPAESTPEALSANGYRVDAHAAYFAAARPIYDGLKRCIGQLGGVLLLMQTEGLDRARADAVLNSARDQLRELKERSRAFPVPSAARRHHLELGRLLELLGSVYHRLERTADLIDPGGAQLNDAVATLFACHGGLLAAAEPRAGLAPVDFRAACCTCRQPGRDAAVT
jgi:hypothetical protein